MSAKDELEKLYNKLDDESNSTTTIFIEYRKIMQIVPNNINIRYYHAASQNLSVN